MAKKINQDLIKEINILEQNKNCFFNNCNSKAINSHIISKWLLKSIFPKGKFVADPNKHWNGKGFLDKFYVE